MNTECVEALKGAGFHITENANAVEGISYHLYEGLVEEERSAGSDLPVLRIIAIKATSVIGGTG